MNALRQRLKELDSSSFESLVFDILKDRHPTLEVKKVQGESGDLGLDVFAGAFSAALTIWQCKHFPNGVRDSQKGQIRQSLQQALQYFKPKTWILCLSVNLDEKAHRWFQKLQNTYSQQVQLELFQASDIVHELIHRRAIREAYFPGASIDVAGIRSLIARTDKHSIAEISQLAEDNVDDYIGRLKEKDARLDFQVIHSGDVGAAAAQGTIERYGRQPGLVSTITDGSRTLNIFARDVEALKRDPLKVTFTLKGKEAHEKLIAALKTGAPQEFNVGEVLNVKSDLDFALPAGVYTNPRLVLLPPDELKERRLHMRVTFRRESDEIRYEFLEFGVEHVGLEEVTIATVDKSLPFRLAMRLPRPAPVDGLGESHFSITENFQGRQISAVHKVARAMVMLQEGGEFELYDLKRESVFMRASVTSSDASEKRRFCKTLGEFARVALAFGYDLVLPERIQMADFEALALLQAVLDGKPVPLGDMRASLVKSREHAAAFLESVEKETMLRMEVHRLTPMPQIFGVNIDTGPCVLLCERATIREAQRVRADYERAPEGAAIPVIFDVLGSVMIGRAPAPGPAKVSVRPISEPG